MPRSHAVRRGAVAPFVAVMLVMILGFAAFSIDLGYIAVVRTEAQAAADSAANAGAAKLFQHYRAAPIVGGVPVQTAADIQAAKDEARLFASRNRVGGVGGDLQSGDIDVGFMFNVFDHSNFNATSELDTTGWPARPYNTVRVRVKRDGSHSGGSLSLSFARVLNQNTANISATATSSFVFSQPEGGLLPFAYHIDKWNALLAATSTGLTPVPSLGIDIDLRDDFTDDPETSTPSGVTSGADTFLEDDFFPIRTTPGNVGTINFSMSRTGNSTSELRDLILNGPNATNYPDLPAILNASLSNPVPVNGDPGVSAGMESAVLQIIGRPAVLPLYNVVTGQGNNTFYSLVGFAPIIVVEADLHGGNKRLMFQPQVNARGGTFDPNNPNPNFLFTRGSPGLVR